MNKFSQEEIMLEPELLYNKKYNTAQHSCLLTVDFSFEV